MSTRTTLRTGITITPDGAASTFTFTPDNALDVFQKQVGGYIEAVPITDQLVMYADEEGLIKYQSRKHLNWSAMHLIARYHGRSQAIVGPVIVVGAPDDAGDNASLSAETTTILVRIAGEAPRMP